MNRRNNNVKNSLSTRLQLPFADDLLPRYNGSAALSEVRRNDGPSPARAPAQAHAASRVLLPPDAGYARAGLPNRIALRHPSMNWPAARSHRQVVDQV